MKSYTMKKILSIILCVCTLVSCGPKKEKTESGKFMPFADGYGFVLPIAPQQDSKQRDYSITVTFEDDAVYMRSHYELADPFLSIMYQSDESESGHETTQVSLDFIGRKNGDWIYSTGYSWFIPKSLASKVLHAGFYYAPINVGIKTVETIGPDGSSAQIPDFTGYQFLFDAKEFSIYFKEFINHLN